MKVQIEIPKEKLLQVLVPEDVTECVVVNYGYAGTWLMENNSTKLNAWKIKIPNGNYKVLGRFKDVLVDNYADVETDKNFLLLKL